MYLKYFPKDADVGALVQLAMNMTQTALFRAYEIVELEERPLNEDERRALDSLVNLFQIAEHDVKKFKKRLQH